MSIMPAALAALVFLAQAEPPAPTAPDAAAVAADAREEAKKKEAEAKAIVAEFRKETKNLKSEDDLSAAIKTLGDTQHPVILQELTRWLGNASAVVCGAAAGELVRYENDKDAAEALLRAARNRKDRDGIVICLASVGDVGHRASAVGLLNFFNHKDVEVCKAAIDSCGRLKSKSTIDRLIALARELDGIRTDEKKAGAAVGPRGATPAKTPNPQQAADLDRRNTLLPLTYSVLTTITGQDWGTVKEWDVWWKKSKADFKELE